MFWRSKLLYFTSLLMFWRKELSLRWRKLELEVGIIKSLCSMSFSPRSSSVNSTMSCSKISWRLMGRRKSSRYHHFCRSELFQGVFWYKKLMYFVEDKRNPNHLYPWRVKDKCDTPSNEAYWRTKNNTKKLVCAKTTRKILPKFFFV